MDRITILGSSNAVAKRNQENAYFLIESATRKIMVDCGNHPAAGLARAGVNINQLTDLILTHFHADHVGSLPLLIMDMWLEKRTTPLNIYGLEYTIERVHKLLDLFDWQKWTNMFPVNFVIVPEDGKIGMISDDSIEVNALPVLHLIPTMGVRIEFSSGKKFAYTCDTEPCENVITLAQSVDVLLQEAAGPGKGHTSAEQAGENATRCGVSQLVLIHFEARNGTEILRSDARKTFSGNVELAFDGMIL